MKKAFTLLRDKSLPKGDALALAEFAGIQAAKLICEDLELVLSGAGNIHLGMIWR